MTATVAELLARLTIFPMPVHIDGRKAQVSDGFHPKGDMAFRNGVGHRGEDYLYRKKKSSRPVHPFSSKWYEIPTEYPVPSLAAGPGVIHAIGWKSTGWHVVIDHGDGVGTAHHHGQRKSEQLGLKVGMHVKAGQPVQIVGGSPVGYGLVHLHHDVAIRGRFIDPAPYRKGWKHLELDEAWLLAPSAAGVTPLDDAAATAVEEAGGALSGVASRLLDLLG